MTSTYVLNEQTIFGLHKMDFLPWSLPRFEPSKRSEEKFESSEELNVSFGYQCSMTQNNASVEPCKFEISTEIEAEDSNITARSSSFSCLSGAALSANYTLANTNICNGLIGEEILPHLDSPKSFKRLGSSPSLSRLDSSSCSPRGISPLAESTSTDSDILESCKCLLKPSSAPTVIGISSFLNARDVQLAGGAAGEDRVQAVYSEENGWLFCGVYDGFNGRDAADYLASTLYDNIVLYLQHKEWVTKQGDDVSTSSSMWNSMSCNPDAIGIQNNPNAISKISDVESSSETFRSGVLDCLTQALAQTESEFMQRVEEEMDDRPDLVSVGSSVLAMLLHGVDLYVINLGDSRAVLATSKGPGKDHLQAMQLTEIHSVDNNNECLKVLADHPDDPSPLTFGKVKGKLKLTRALGVGYLKKSKLNDALMGILRVRNLCSPPYIYTQPFTTSHKISEDDLFVVLGSDGLFDFFSNDEVVNLVYGFIQDNPTGDPAKYLVEQLVIRAAENAGLKSITFLRFELNFQVLPHDIRWDEKIPPLTFKTEMPLIDPPPSISHAIWRFGTGRTWRTPSSWSSGRGKSSGVMFE